MSNVYEIMRGVKTVKDFTQSVNMGLHFVFSGFRLTQILSFPESVGCAACVASRKTIF